MKHATIRIPWKDGLHMRRAALLAKIAGRFGSTIQLRLRGRVADARNILGVLILCATLNSPVDIEANGDDEQSAIDAVQTFFSERGP
jgi:phosphocarrier protein